MNRLKTKYMHAARTGLIFRNINILALAVKVDDSKC
jgi:hypothetical protein